MQVELLTQELHATENDKGLEVKRLEMQLQDTRQQLQGYEKIEKELDDIVMESAQSRLEGAGGWGGGREGGRGDGGRGQGGRMIPIG